MIVDNKRYTYAQLDGLPDDLTMEKAKTIVVDTDGLAFQSHHSFLSSMFPCTIDHDGHAHKSAEHIYWYDIAKLAGDQRAMEQVRAAKDGYSAKLIGERIKITPEIKQQKEQIMANAQDKKFRQNPVIRQKLMDTKGTLYEATKDEFFGSGLTLSQKPLFGKAGMPGNNKLGHQLMDLRGVFRTETS